MPLGNENLKSCGPHASQTYGSTQDASIQSNPLSDASLKTRDNTTELSSWAEERFWCWTVSEQWGHHYPVQPSLICPIFCFPKSNRSNTNDQDWTGHDNLAVLVMLQGRLPAKYTVDLTWQTRSPDNSGTSVWKLRLPQHVHQWKDKVEATRWSTAICAECQQEHRLN